MKPLRVAIVTRHFWPSVGGSERILANLAGGLHAAGGTVTVLTARTYPRWPAEIHYQEAHVVRLSPSPNGRWNTFRYLRALAAWLREHRAEFDLVYVSGMRDEAAAVLRTVRGKVPVVLRPIETGRWGDCVWQIETAGGRRIKSACLKATALAAPTPIARRELQAAGYPRTRIHDLWPGIELPPPRTMATRSAARALLTEANPLLHLPDSAPLTVYAGKLEEGRGVAELIAAWATVASQFPAARLWLSGPGSQRAALARQIEALHLANRVLLVGVFVDVAALLAAADLYVSPAPQGSSIGLLEAMGAGLPVVAIDAADNRWLVSTDENGLLTPVEDVPALAEALVRVLGQAETAARLAVAARGTAEQFSIAKMVGDHLHLFQELTEPNAPRSAVDRPSAGMSIA